MAQCNLAAVHGTEHLVLELNGVERQFQRGQLNQTEQQLSALLTGLGSDAPLSSGYHRLTKMMGQIHFNSKQYDEALDWAQRCDTYLNRISARGIDLTSVRLDVAALLGRIHQERDEWPQARNSFQRALDLNNEQSPANAIRELDVLTNLAEVLRSADEEDELARLRPSIEHQDTVDRRHEPDASGFERLAIAYLEKSRQLYENILPRIASERAEDERVPLELTVLQTLQNVTYQLYVNGHRSNAEVIAAAKRLLNRLDETALKTDRRVFEAKTLLGSVHLRDKNLDAAKSSLTDARNYWENRTPPDHTLTMQTLMFLAQVERENGSSLAAQELLERSLDICTTRLSDDTDLLASLNIQLGHLLAASQNRDEAENHFVEAIRLAREAADPISELTCNIELANIAISHENISQKNIIRVQQILAESTGICAQHLSEDDSMTLQVRHQLALFHVLRDRTQANPQDRETARRLWKNILNIQEEQKHPPDQQARTLHYLARLSYRDWSEG
jgi:tetratricopeptide (TPR) repeat protein